MKKPSASGASSTGRDPGITLRQLRYLDAVDRFRHFRRAAEQCGVRQPSLSTQIQVLEGALGVRLIERSRSGVTLTPVGREVVARARRVLDEVQGISDFTSEAQTGLAGTIRLGAKPTLGPYLLPRVVARLHRQHPGLSLYVRESDPRELEHELGRGVHDLILAQLPVAGADFVTERLFREPLYLALAVDHPLASAETVDPAALAGTRVLSLSPRFHLHDQISRICQDYGATLLRDYEGTSLDALRQMVGMGMGLTFLPALYVVSEIPKSGDVVVKTLKGKRLDRSIGLVWRKSAGRAPAFHQIADVIRRVAAEEFEDLTVEA